MAKANQSDADKAPATIPARVLVEGAFGPANSIAEVTAEQVKASPEMLDADPAAVAYVKSLTA